MPTEIQPGAGLAIEAAAEHAVENDIGRGRLVLRRFLRKKVAVGGLVVLLLLIAFAFIGPYFTHWDYKSTDYDAFLKGPSSNHWFGTT
ncbi:MAG: glutathione transport system permease protein, partial [Actinomycetota bacterium]